MQRTLRSFSDSPGLLRAGTEGYLFQGGETKKLSAPIALALILVLFASASASGAGLKGRSAFSGMGHLGFPISGFADEEKGMAKTGYGFGISLEYFPSDHFALGGSFSYLVFGSKTGHFEEEVRDIIYRELHRWYEVDADVKQELPTFGVFGKYLVRPYSPACPYAKLGLGFGKYSLTGDAKVNGWSAEATASFDSKFYFTVGPGILHRMSEDVALVLEVVYIQVFTDQTESEATLTVGTYELKEDWGLDFDTQYLGIYTGVCVFFGGR
jgi:opacity protein-like surface antigen